MFDEYDDDIAIGIDSAIKKLKKFSDLTRKKRRKIMKSLLTSEEFMTFLFKPDMTNKNSKTMVMDQISDLYELMIKPTAILAILDVIDHEGYMEFNQTHATFINSITSMAIESANEKLRKIDVLKAKKEISKYDAEEQAEKVQQYSSYVAKLIKAMHKIVKPLVSIIRKKTGLAENYADIFAINNPEHKFIDKFKIGFYLNNTLQLIYQEANESGIRVRLEDEDWRNLFGNIYGKDNIAECATFILLEGAGRISKYQADKENVKDIWDSLTAFALSELDRSPDKLRDQMIELYIKRIDKMFANGARELRVDLTKIDSLMFPKLSDTIKKYIDKIETILKR